MVLTTMKQWTITRTDRGFDGLHLDEEAAVPKLGDNDVLVKFHAVSLNYRDLMMPRGEYPFPLSLPIVPCSDGAGEVISTGSKVTKWNIGDRVITLMNQTHLYGAFSPAALESALGGSVDGTLRQYGAFNEQGLVRAPRNLSYAEASTLCCAGVTSWNALYGLKALKPGQSVLILGTGGVSLFALQFAKAAGAKVIATTSSDYKAKMLYGLEVDYVINYTRDPDWGSTARKLSPDGQGVDHIIEIGGAGTLHQSIKAVKFEGLISVIGAVANSDPSASVPSILDCWLHQCVVRGVGVGSRAMMEEMVDAVENNDIHPVLDEKTFSLKQAKEALKHFADGANFGKTIVDLD